MNDLEVYDDACQDAIAPVFAEFGYREASGGSTDVRSLSENGIGVAAANVACGYHRPHTENESIVHAEAERARELILWMCREFGGARCPTDSPRRVVGAAAARSL